MNKILKIYKSQNLQYLESKCPLSNLFQNPQSAHSELLFRQAGLCFPFDGNEQIDL